MILKLNKVVIVTCVLCLFLDYSSLGRSRTVWVMNFRMVGMLLVILKLALTT